MFFVLVVVLVLENGATKHEQKLVEDEHEYEYEYAYDDDIIEAILTNFPIGKLT